MATGPDTENDPESTQEWLNPFADDPSERPLGLPWAVP